MNQPYEQQTQQPNTPMMNEKLPGIDKLPKLDENAATSPSSYVDNKGMCSSYAYLPPPPPSSNSYTMNPGLVYHQNMSPPLTPAVSPSSILLDSMQYKRKFSVDVGPFGFGTNVAMQDQFRRSSCSAVSMEDQQQQQQQQQQDYGFLNGNTTTPEYNVVKTNRRGSRANLTGPATQHKHVCKYPYCSWSFKRYEHLKRHMLVHTGKRPHVCHYPGCGKSFSRSDNFHAHYRTHTKKENMLQGKKSMSAVKQITSPSVYDYAPKTATTTSFDMYQDMYNTRPHFAQQESVYQDQQHYNFSDETQNQFNLNQNLSDTTVLGHEVNHHHLYTHSYPSHHLGPYGYYPIQQQQEHPESIAAAAAVVVAAAMTKKEPSQQKNHTCPVPQCQRGFKRLEHLKRHMRIHTLERPFGCTFPNCNKTFSRSDNLSQHMKTHQRVEDRRRKSHKQQQQQETMSWHSSTTVGC